MKQFLVSKGHNGYLAEIKEGGFHVFGNFSSLVTFLEEEFNEGDPKETQGSTTSEPSSDTTVSNQEP